MDEMAFLALFTVVALMMLAGLAASTAWIIYDTRRGERRLAEVTYTVGLETRRMMDRMERSAAEAEREWRQMDRDREILMRAIFERVDRAKGDA